MTGQPLGSEDLFPYCFNSLVPKLWLYSVCVCLCVCLLCVFFVCVFVCVCVCFCVCTGMRTFYSSHTFLPTGLTHHEILSTTARFLGGSFETTSQAITFLVYNLATNPDVMKKLQDEIDKVFPKQGVLQDHPPQFH